MPYFQYIVINAENKKLSGTISADDEIKARSDLNNLGFSVISLNPIQTEEYEKLQGERTIFEFIAYDKHSKKIKGTIPADDKYHGYKKLIEEYGFNILFLYLKNASEQDIEAEKLKGLDDLKIKLTEEKQNIALKKTETVESSAKSDQDFQQKALEGKIAMILGKVKEILDKYEQDIQPEKLREIKNLVDKLVRIKSSTNLTFVEKTCEELLHAIQAQELFIQDEKLKSEKSAINFETKKLLIELHQHKESQKSLTIDSVIGTLKQLEKNKTKTSWVQKTLTPFVVNIAKMFEVPEEVKLLKEQIKNTNSQIITYGKLWLTSKKDEKAEIKKALLTLWQERKRLQRELKKCRVTLKGETKTASIGVLSYLYREMSLFTGWLLCFYLVLYFIGNYAKTKNLSFLPSYLIQFYDIPVLKKLTVIIFIAHIVVSTKLLYFPKSITASILVIPLTIFLSLFLIINF